jgi:hypothetical protein
MENNTRQVFHTQEFDYPEWPPILTAAINEKEESDSPLPRFFSVSMSPAGPPKLNRTYFMMSYWSEAMAHKYPI